MSYWIFGAFYFKYASLYQLQCVLHNVQFVIFEKKIRYLFFNLKNKWYRVNLKNTLYIKNLKFLFLFFKNNNNQLIINQLIHFNFFCENN